MQLTTVYQAFKQWCGQCGNGTSTAGKIVKGCLWDDN